MGYGCEGEWLGKPFETSYGGVFQTKNINQFIYSQDIYLDGLREGESFIPYGKWRTSVGYPSMDRYYGELEDFLPEFGRTAIIPMKRTAFGIKIVVNGVPDGKLTWGGFSDNHSFFGNEEYTGLEKLVYSHIYTFFNVYDCWKSKEAYTQNFTINFTWTRTNGYKQYFNEMIIVKRNVMTTITVNLKGGANDVSIGINEDDTPMDNEDVNVEYNGGDLNDNPVNPEE